MMLTLCKEQKITSLLSPFISDRKYHEFDLINHRQPNFDQHDGCFFIDPNNNSNNNNTGLQWPSVSSNGTVSNHCRRFYVGGNSNHRLSCKRNDERTRERCVLFILDLSSFATLQCSIGTEMDHSTSVHRADLFVRLLAQFNSFYQ
jgi:hypothetical protein